MDLDRLLKLHLLVVRSGEENLARWWNTKGQLGRLPLEDRLLLTRDVLRRLPPLHASRLHGARPCARSTEDHGQIREDLARWISEQSRGTHTNRKDD